jgi:hypothetical protein
MYAAMMQQGLDPMAAQQQQVASYAPAHLSAGPLSGQIGMSMPQMMAQVKQNRDNRIQGVHQMQQMGGI